jgi:hypothetical protein
MSGSNKSTEKLSPLKTEPATLKKRGNDAFQRNKLASAAELYSSALTHPDITLEDKISCLSNRALVNLRMEQWERAEEDARNVLKLDSQHEKAKYRLAAASIRLGKADVAQALANELIQGSPKDSSFQQLLKETENAKNEQMGNYDLAAMRKDANAGKGDAFHADFVSFKTELGVSIPLPNGTSYRGCKALHDIDENELICASNAFVFVDKTETHGSSEIEQMFQKMNMGSTGRICDKVVALLKKRPALGEKLYGLSAGSRFADMTAEEKKKTIDIPRIRAILTSNTFGIYGESSDCRVHWQKSVKFQSLGRPLSKSEHDELHEGLSSGSGLWIHESLFNHSCAPNCTWVQIGDHMFIRSARPIAAGEELCVTYLSKLDTYQARVGKFARWADGFKCQCEWCYSMRTMPELFRITNEVEEAYEEASRRVTLLGTRMWLAAEQVLPCKEREKLLTQFKRYPLHIQHNAGANLRVFQGTWLNHKGRTAEALAMYEEAAAIGYAVRGSAGMERAKDLWRVAGAAMCCKKVTDATRALKSVWESSDFSSFSSTSEARQAFVDLTLKYALPWWVNDPNCHAEYEVLKKLARQVCEGKTEKQTSAAIDVGKGKSRAKKGRRK